MEQAFRLLPGDVTAAQQLSGRALDIAKGEGREDVSSILGQLVQAQGAARVTNIGQLGSTAIPAALSVVKAGGTSEEGLELFSALTNIAGDEEGRQTSTALISLVEQLKGFGKDDKDPTGVDQDVAGIAGFDKFAEATDTNQRIEVLQQNRELADAFLAGASFEKKLLTPIQSLVTGDESAVAQLQAAQASITGGGAASAKAFEDKVAFLDETSGEDVADAARKLGVILEGQDLNPDRARQGFARKTLEDAFGRVNLAGLDSSKTNIALAQFEQSVAGGADPVSAAVTQLETAQSDFETTPFFKGDGEKGIAALQEVIDVLKKIERKPEPNRGANAPKQVPAAALGANQ